MSPKHGGCRPACPSRRPSGYSRAVAAGDFIFVSGCTSIADGELVYEGDMAGRPNRLCERGRGAAELGAGLADVVRTRIYVTDISRLGGGGRGARLAFEDAPPATSMIQVAALIDPRMLVEVEAVAHREGGPDADEAEPDESQVPPDAIRLDDPSTNDAI